VLNARLNPRYAPVLIRDIERQAETLTDSVDDALNDPLHCIDGTAPTADAVTLGFGVYLFEESGEGASATTAGDDYGTNAGTDRRRQPNLKKRKVRKK
jgi:hypothetical protein